MNEPSTLPDIDQAKKLLDALVEIEEELRKHDDNVKAAYERAKSENNLKVDLKGIGNTSFSKIKRSLKEFLESGKTEYPTQGELVSFATKIEKIKNVYRPDIKKPFKTTRKGKQDFIGNSWFLYFFYIDPGSNSEPELGRAVLRITDEEAENPVRCINLIDDGISVNYKGRYDYINNQVIYFDLESDNPEIESPRLHIKVSCSNRTEKISLGAYITYENNKITTGSMVLQLIDKDKKEDEISAAALSNRNHPELFKKVPHAIRQYLSLKSLNYCKITNNVHTEEALNSFLYKFERFDRKLFFFDEDKPIVFISSPHCSINEETQATHRNSIESLIKRIKQQEKRVRFAWPFKNKGSSIDPTDFNRNLELLKRTRFYVLIYTGADKGSFALTELGWALAFCKVILVFHTNETLSDRLMSLNGLGVHVQLINISDINDVKIYETLHREIERYYKGNGKSIDID